MTALSLLSKLQSLQADRRGVTAIEYGLIAALVAIAIITAVSLLGTNLSAEFTYIAGKV